ncbi:MAG: hypothetical protein AAF990_24795 [Bacteroidota bacterium]
MKNTIRSHSLPRLLLSYAILIGCGLVFPLEISAQFKRFASSEKIKGVSFSGPQKAGWQLNMFKNIQVSKAEWVALIPEATLNRQSLELRPDSENDCWSETVEANIQGIKMAKRAGLRVMLKPHIVLGEKTSYDRTGRASWRGLFRPQNEKDWQTWEKNYEAYILQLAYIAQSLKVDLFCVGTELKFSAVERAAFWRQLIQKVRRVYSGPLTYSANWDEYDLIGFWQSLDYIGVDTYFPINEAKYPDVDTTVKNWKVIQKKLKRISRKEGRQILITEFGYRNVYFAGKEPWLHDAGNETPFDQAQVNLYQAFFQAFWDKSWVAGGFSWKWFYQPQPKGNTNFSIQDKPALKVLQKWYSR